MRSATGALVPLGTLVEIRDTAGPTLVQRYNMYVSVPLQGNPAPGVSTGTALDKMEALAAADPAARHDLRMDGTSPSRRRQTGNTAIFIFALSVLFVFLALAAQYESWVLPLAIILIVPLGVLAALIGVYLRGLDNNILTQIGLIVLIGLAAKNAILIVEFARQARGRGQDADRGGGRGQPAAPAADPDDGLRLHLRRGAAGDRHRPGRRNAPVARHGGVLGHAGRDLLRPVPDAGLLRGAALGRSPPPRIRVFPTPQGCGTEAVDLWVKNSISMGTPPRNFATE